MILKIGYPQFCRLHLAISVQKGVNKRLQSRSEQTKKSVLTSFQVDDSTLVGTVLVKTRCNLVLPPFPLVVTFTTSFCSAELVLGLAGPVKCLFLLVHTLDLDLISTLIRQEDEKDLQCKGLAR